jgi:hypothetical protein
MRSSFLPPANKCSSPTKDLRTNQNAVKAAKPNARKAAEAGHTLPQCGQKPKPVVLNAEKKPLFPSGLLKGARYSVGNAFNSEGHWARRKKLPKFIEHNKGRLNLI